MQWNCSVYLQMLARRKQKYRCSSCRKCQNVLAVTGSGSGFLRRFSEYLNDTVKISIRDQHFCIRADQDRFPAHSFYKCKGSIMIRLHLHEPETSNQKQTDHAPVFIVLNHTSIHFFLILKHESCAIVPGPVKVQHFSLSDTRIACHRGRPEAKLQTFPIGHTNSVSSGQT